LIALLALVTTVATTGCGSLMQRTANLEDDELYLRHGEEFITDAEYLAYAYEQAGYNVDAEEDNFQESRSGDGFQSSFGYVPRSLLGRSMLRGYMTPYGAAGFGPNPYDPFGSSFYGGYGVNGQGFYDPYTPYGSPMGGTGFGYNMWGVNPYMGNQWGTGWNTGWGMNPYAMGPYGSGMYGYNPYGFGNVYGGNPGWGGWGSDVYETTNVVVGVRTPIWASSAVNSNSGGGRLLTNKVDTQEAAPPVTIWRGIDAVQEKAAERLSRGQRATPTSPTSPNPARTTTYGKGGTSKGRASQGTQRSSWGQEGESRTAPTARPSSNRGSSSRGSSNRNSSWSGSSGGSRSSGTSTKPSSGRSGGSSRSGGRGGNP
jgi:hypothetical protein